jgi:homoserine kinase type II
MAHLAQHGIPCPAPIANRDNALLGTLNGKPATLVTCLPGVPVMNPAQRHCAQVGAMLAAMHLAAMGYAGTLANPRGLRWQRETAPEVMPFLDAARRDLLVSELDFQLCQRFEVLPCGPVHADLFRDNVLFEGEAAMQRIGGVIDFYFAGIDSFAFDVAVTVNDWCVDPGGNIDPCRADSLLAAYQATRAFSNAERLAWPAVLRAAALRFWMSRLYDFYLPRPGELTHAHDPEHFRRVLERRRTGTVPLPSSSLPSGPRS